MIYRAVRDDVLAAHDDAAGPAASCFVLGLILIAAPVRLRRLRPWLP